MPKVVVVSLVVLAFATAGVARATPPLLKPYVVMVVDTSGSMADAVIPATTPTCGGTTSKLDHARCAVNTIANGDGDIVFALGRYRQTVGGTTTAATFPSGCTDTGQAQCTDYDSMTNTGCNVATGAGCAGSGSNDSSLELLTALVDGQSSSAAQWTNLTGNTCTATGTDPEIWKADGSTPIAGVFKGLRDYWTGVATATDGTAATIWPSTSAGFSPIANDPNTAFLPRRCAIRRRGTPAPTAALASAARTSSFCSPTVRRPARPSQTRSQRRTRC